MAQRWQSPGEVFGDVALLLFLLAQCFDGVLTYVGVQTMGRGIEANPLLSHLIGALGAGAALLSAKIVAAGFGIILHLRRVHRTVMLLAALYLAAAVVPWTALLFLTD